MGLVLSDLIPMDQDWVWSGLVQPLKNPILSDLIGYQTRPDPIRSDSVGGPISILSNTLNTAAACDDSVPGGPHSGGREDGGERAKQS